MVLVAIMAAAGFTLALPAVSASATTTNVPCDATDLVNDVTSAASGDTLNLAADCTYSVTPVGINSGLVIANSLTIEGNGATINASTVDTAAALFDVEVGANLTLEGVTIANTHNIYGFGGGIFNQGTVTVTNSTLSDDSGDSGGGIYNYNGGTVTVTGSILLNDYASGTNGYGGGIYNFSGGVVTINNSTLSGNSAVVGGGIENYGTTTVTNSTLSRNYAEYTAGGIDNDGSVTVTNSTLSGNSALRWGGGIVNDGTASVSNSTLWDNSAAVGGDEGTGGGLFSDGGTFNVTATIVAGSKTGSDCDAVIIDGGYNLDDDGTCGFSGTSLSDTPAGLDPSGLQNNGGPTQTIAPRIG